MTSPTPEELQAQIVALQAQAATREELTLAWQFSGALSGGNFVQTYQGGGYVQSLWCAPYAAKLLSADIVRDYDVGALSDVNYVSVVLCRENTANVRTNIVTKTTKATGGEVLNPRDRWPLTNSTWDDDAATFAPGDILQLLISTKGTATWKHPTCLTVRLAPL